MSAELAASLAVKYASDLPEKVADRIFSLAWQHGHACGDSDVEYYYGDFADLAAVAYKAGVDQ